MASTLIELPSLIEQPLSLSELLNESVASVRQREASQIGELLYDHNDRVVIFGAGGLGRQAIVKLRELGVEPRAICDNNVSLWGTHIDGIPVYSLPDAAARFRNSLFLVAVWNPHHWFGETAERLRIHGARSVVSYMPLFWRFPADFMPVRMFNDLPSKIYQAADDVLAAEDLMADDLSREIYRANICWRALGIPDFMPARPIENTYFPPDLFTCAPYESIVDCGAYDGDTIKQILSRYGDRFASVLSLEGDAISCNKLETYVASLPAFVQDKIRLIPGAVGRERCVVRFTADGGTGSHIDSTAGVDVQCYPLDDLMAELNIPAPVTMIKMDIEGAEFDSLLGAQKIITRDRPILAICVYHLQHDLWRLPLLIHSMIPEYKLYLRAYEGDGFQTVLYAVPPHRQLTARKHPGSVHPRKQLSA